MTQDNDKKTNRKFETTTQIKLADHYGEDEVTICEPLKSTAKNTAEDKEEEITVKMPKPQKKAKPTVEELLKMKQQDHKSQNEKKSSNQGQSTKSKPQTIYVSKSKKSVYSNVLLEIPSQKSPNLRNILTGILSGVILLVGALFAYKYKTSITTASQPKPVTKIVQNTPSNVKLSAVKFFNLQSEPQDPKQLHPGDTIVLVFSVSDWSGNPDISSDIRIYDHTGHMLLFKPKYAAFNDSASAETDTLKVATQITLNQSVPAGFYRIIIHIKDEKTGYLTERQARIKISPKPII